MGGLARAVIHLPGPDARVLGVTKKGQKRIFFCKRDQIGILLAKEVVTVILSVLG